MAGVTTRVSHQHAGLRSAIRTLSFDRQGGELWSAQATLLKDSSHDTTKLPTLNSTSLHTPPAPTAPFNVLISNDTTPRHSAESARRQPTQQRQVPPPVLLERLPHSRSASDNIAFGVGATPRSGWRRPGEPRRGGSRDQTNHRCHRIRVIQPPALQNVGRSWRWLDVHFRVQEYGHVAQTSLGSLNVPRCQ